MAFPITQATSRRSSRSVDTLRFSQKAAYDTARAELERLDLLKFATLDDDAASVEFPQAAKTPTGISTSCPD